jgi:hypothetical protein
VRPVPIDVVGLRFAARLAARIAARLAAGRPFALAAVCDGGIALATELAGPLGVAAVGTAGFVEATDAGTRTRLVVGEVDTRWAIRAKIKASCRCIRMAADTSRHQVDLGNLRIK